MATSVQPNAAMADPKSAAPAGSAPISASVRPIDAPMTAHPANRTADCTMSTVRAPSDPECTKSARPDSSSPRSTRVVAVSAQTPKMSVRYSPASHTAKPPTVSTAVAGPAIMRTPGSSPHTRSIRRDASSG